MISLIIDGLADPLRPVGIPWTWGRYPCMIGSISGSGRNTMAFIRMKDVEGLVFVPEDTGAAKKHPCADCFHCQWCSDNRCTLCLQAKPREEDQSDIITIGPPPMKDREP